VQQLIENNIEEITHTDALGWSPLHHAAFVGAKKERGTADPQRRRCKCSKQRRNDAIAFSNSYIEDEGRFFIGQERCRSRS
jgi:hypothetical protein